jgi:carbon monoxide dehydrogenase subunit G
VPSADFSHTVAVAASPEAAWDRLQDPAVWTGIGPIERVHDPRFGRNGSLQGFAWKASVAGRHWTGTARTTASDRPDVMQLTLEGTEVHLHLAARLMAGDGGSRMEIRIAARSKGMLAGLFWGVIEAAIRSSLPDQAVEFARRLESA